MSISFIMYFSPNRIKNLTQTLYFISKRENIKEYELITICQDSCEKPISSFKLHNHINLKMNYYNKSIMCNIGVKNSNFENIVILDSDRILTYKYFYRNLLNLKEKIIITTKYISILNKEYSNKKIELNKITKIIEERSNNHGSKNAFSGNTLMKKSDYLEVGGMDESFVGYGFADNDMTRNVLKNGCKIVYLDEEELHLYHLREIYWKGRIIGDDIFCVITAINYIKYLLKWKELPQKEIYNIFDKVSNNKSKIPLELLNEYNKLKDIFNKKFRLI